MNIIEIHRVGGKLFMIPLTICFLINIGLVAFIVIRRSAGKPQPSFGLEAVRQIGGLACAWGVLSTVIGLFFALGDLAESQEIIPFNVIMGGLKVGLITAEYGLIIFVLSLLAYIILKATTKTKEA